MSPRRGSIGLLVTLQRCRADGAGQCVVEHADVGDGLPERGGVIDGQFRTIIIAVPLSGLKIDRDCGVGMGGAEGAVGSLLRLHSAFHHSDTHPAFRIVHFLRKAHR